MARDYANSRAPRKKRAGTSAKNNSTTVSFIKLLVAMVVLAIVIGGLWYIKSQNKRGEDSSLSKTPQKKDIPIVDQRPKEDPYEYRKLLESSEIKPANKPANNSSKKPSKVNTPELIIDMSRKESRQAEAKRAQDILNGSLNTPGESKVHTVKLGQDDKILMVDGTTFRAAETSSTKLTADQIEANPRYQKGSGKANTSTKLSLGTSGQYLMQCGAFKSFSQAVALKQKLEAKGQKVRIVNADVNKIIWYRVIIGPYATKNMATDVLTKLKSVKVVSNCNVFLIK